MVPTERSRICRYCGLEAPRAQWRPFTWTEKHEAICPKNPSNSKTPKTKHISYSSREEYITDLEDMLMQKYRVGYSALHKRLVVEKSNQLLNRTI